MDEDCAEYPEGPYGFRGAASCGASCGLGEQRDIYEATMAVEEWAAYLIKEREEAAFEQWVEFLVEQREGGNKDIGDTILSKFS